PRPQEPAERRQDAAVRVRQRVDRGATRAALRQVLHDRDPVRRVRRRGRAAVPVGGHVPRSRVGRTALGHAVRAAPGGGPRLRMEERRDGMGDLKTTRVLEGSETGFATTRFDDLLNWAKKYSLFQYPFVTACCGMEFMAMAS